jgi:hypothetical protein
MAQTVKKPIAKKATVKKPVVTKKTPAKAVKRVAPTKRSTAKQANLSYDQRVQLMTMIFSGLSLVFLIAVLIRYA